jgi:cytochrome oxidase Cu insertion factor (SCO1/SenC/PrrC family)
MAMITLPCPTALAFTVRIAAVLSTLCVLAHGMNAAGLKAAPDDLVAAATIAQPRESTARQRGRVHELLADPEYAGRLPRVTIVEFVRVAPGDMCNATGEGFQQIQTAILRQHLEDRVRLLTISVDPVDLAPGNLSAYAQRMQADPRVWTLMHAQSPAALDEAGAGALSAAPSRPSAGLHLVDGQGRLAGTFEPGEPGAALDAAVRLNAQLRLL